MPAVLTAELLKKADAREAEKEEKQNRFVANARNVKVIEAGEAVTRHSASRSSSESKVLSTAMFSSILFMSSLSSSIYSKRSNGMARKGDELAHRSQLAQLCKLQPTKCRRRTQTWMMSQLKKTKDNVQRFCVRDHKLRQHPANVDTCKNCSRCTEQG